MTTQQPEKSGFRWKSPTGLALIGFLAVAAFYLLAEHTAHVLGSLPWLIFLIFFLLMHFFMHGKHGHGGHGAEKPAEHAEHDHESTHQSTPGGG